MKRIYIVVCLLLFFVLSDYAQMKSRFKIEGSIKGLKAGSKLFLLIKKGDKIDTVSQSIAKPESFQFAKVRLPYYPDFYLITIQTEFVDNLQLFLDQAGDVRINGELKCWPNVMVTGSTTHDEYLTYRKLINIANREFDSLQAVGASKEQMAENNRKARVPFFEQFQNSYVIPYSLLMWKDEYGKPVSPEVKRPFYDQLSTTAKNSYYGKQLGKQMADYAESKRWMDKLEKSIDNHKSISRDKVMKELTETPDMKASISSLSQGTSFLKEEREMISKLKAATVIVNMSYRNPGDSVTRPNPTSAYVIDESGICVTNYHVGKEYSSKERYKSLSIMTADSKVYPVIKILSCSESDDLMVFQVDTKGDKVAALPLGNTVAEGAKIHVMGHPLGKFYQFTSGVVSGYSTATLAGKPCNIMSITADFNVGSSGGPIVDEYGNVVGTVSRIDGGMKVGVPVSELRKLIEFKK